MLLFKKMRILFSIIYIALAISVLCNVSHVYGNENEAILKISQAEDSIKAAYLSLLDSERKEGDISELVALLNTALECQFEAKRALDLEEYETAVDMAGNVIEVSNVILDTDINFRVVAEHFSEVRFRNQVLLTLGVILSTFFLGSFSWRLFKKYYIRNLMASRLEVSADESG